MAGVTDYTNLLNGTMKLGVWNLIKLDYFIFPLRNCLPYLYRKAKIQNWLSPIQSILLSNVA